MQHKIFHFKRHRRESGQALMEYWPTLPAAVMILIAASAIVHFLTGAFTITHEGLTQSGLTCDAQQETESSRSGPSVAQLGEHTVELVGVVYDPESDTTVVTYRVTNGADPSISHWTLGISQDIYGAVSEVVNENLVSWGTDPTTSVMGIKFDTGYESSGEGGGGNGNNNGGGNGNNGGDSGDTGGDTGSGNGNNGNGNGNGGGNGGGKKSSYSGAAFMSVGYSAQIGFSTGEVREISMILSGQYDFGPVELAIKAGQEVYYGEISAPVRVTAPAEVQTCGEQS